MFSTQPRAACAGQSIDGEVVARAEPAIADGEAGFSRTRSFRERMALTIQSRRSRSDAIIARILTEQADQIRAKSFILQAYDDLARHRLC